MNNLKELREAVEVLKDKINRIDTILVELADAEKAFPNMLGMRYKENAEAFKKEKIIFQTIFSFLTKVLESEMPKELSNIDFNALDHAKLQAQWREGVGMERIWEILAKQFGCKPNKEDCSFKKCNQWARCDNLIQALYNCLYLEEKR